MTTITDMFDDAPRKKSEPIPTRDMAADGAAAEAERKRKTLLGMSGSTMLSGPGGVSSELTGTRRIQG